MHLICFIRISSCNVGPEALSDGLCFKIMGFDAKQIYVTTAISVLNSLTASQVVSCSYNGVSLDAVLNYEWISKFHVPCTICMSIL